jgi:hypothetical protein
MCGTECDADGNGSGQLYMESGIVDGFAGSSKSRKHYAIYSNRKQWFMQFNGNGGGDSKSCSDDKRSI